MTIKEKDVKEAIEWLKERLSACDDGQYYPSISTLKAKELVDAAFEDVIEK